MFGLFTKKQKEPEPSFNCSQCQDTGHFYQNTEITKGRYKQELKFCSCDKGKQLKQGLKEQADDFFDGL